MPKIPKLDKPDEEGIYTDLIQWFASNDSLDLNDLQDDKDFERELNKIKPLTALIEQYQPKIAPEDVTFFKEFVLWALVEAKKLSKSRIAVNMHF